MSIDVRICTKTFSCSVIDFIKRKRKRIRSLPLRISMGNKSITLNQLNISWTVAPPKARRNSFLSAIWPRDTIVLVTDVPILAPITIGTACCGRRTEKKQSICRIHKIPRYEEWLKAIEKSNLCWSNTNHFTIWNSQYFNSHKAQTILLKQCQNAINKNQPIHYDFINLKIVTKVKCTTIYG